MNELTIATPAILTLLAGLFGLVIGSFLNVVAYRVPAGISLLRESRCPACDAPVRPWQNVPVLSWLVLRGRCAACHDPIPVRYPLVELVTGALFAAIAVLLPWQQLVPNLAAGVCVLLAFWWFAGSSIALTLIDLDTKRLPDAIVLPGYLVGIGMLTLACLLGADWWALLRAGIGAAILFGLYALLWLARPGAMGMGDVKLAGLVGLHLGWLGWAAIAVGAIAAFVLGGLYGAGLIATRRAGRKTALAFGPWMIAGAWTGALAGTAIAQLYLGLSGLA
ncbi:MAG: prepilin peptidase [Propionibacteriaceae bacterium]|nr:prepilin peptidase [Propionibacteriaceae bacterium]